MGEKKQEEENALPEGKGEGPAPSTERDDLVAHKGEELIYRVGKKLCTALFQFFAKYWVWLKEHKYNVISGFIVAVAAVYLAFWLAGRGEQKALGKATKQRLHLVVLEAQYNLTDANEIRVAYADANSFGINLNRPNSMAAAVALEDVNILTFLPLHKVSMLRSYVNSISTLNQSLQVHQGVLESQNYRRTIQAKQACQIVHKNAAAVCAGAHVLQEELKEYIDETFFDQKEAESIENRIKCIKRKALKRGVSLSKEN